MAHDLVAEIDVSAVDEQHNHGVQNMGKTINSDSWLAQRVVQDYPLHADNSACKRIVLRESYTVINKQTHSIHVHDGVTPGGHEIPTIDRVVAMLNAYKVFTPAIVDEVVQSTTLALPSATPGLRVLLPYGTHVRLTFLGYGPFTYKFGDEDVAATSGDSPASSGSIIVVAKNDATYVAAYGIGAGSLYVEGGAA